MTHPTHLTDEFNMFLHAPIGEDRNGPLSVLSALARLDLDPWREAADLARAPVEIAIQKLAAIIARLPPGTSELHEPRTVAARLIDFLPRQSEPDIESSDAPAIDAQTNIRAAALFAYVVIYVTVVIGAQSVLDSRRSAVVHANNENSSTASIALPKTATQSPDQ